MKTKIVLLSILAIMLMSGNLLANSISFSDLNVGSNITINDTIWNSNGSNPSGRGGENNETEKTPGERSTIAKQEWDIEGIFWNGNNTLTIIGGFDFQNGVSNWDHDIGDLFIGEFNGYYGNPAAGARFVPESVIDFQRNTDETAGKVGGLLPTGGFDILSGINLGDTSAVTDVDPTSNPYQYVGSGDPIGGGIYSTGIVTETPFAGWGNSDTHYFLQISGLTALAPAINSGDIIHITIGCGNDTARAVATPEPATMLMLGAGLIGLAGFGRRKFKKKA